MTTPNFGDVVDSTFIYSAEQLDGRLYGNSEVSYQGVPTVYHVGDVVYLPYASGETSTMEAVGLAWQAYASGIGPA
jgi:NADH dehydrogenase FAD-containing subunit